MATRVEPGTPFSGRPSGTVTFLFSDIEGSTERWERNHDAMSAALAQHDVLMRATLEARGGYVFKTMGDEFCSAYNRASDAIAAALEAQRAIASENFADVSGLRIRMALHTGIAVERDGDYFGPTLNRVARLLAIGHGGQVLVSRAAAELLRNNMPSDTSLRDLGAHRLRDLAEPEHVYQLVAPDLPEHFPTLRSPDHLPNNLPPQLTSFVGRDEVVAEIKKLIGRNRLVTLTGAGGAGKTRCAIQLGAELLDGAFDGVWLAELAPISDPMLVSKAIAQSLNVQEQPSRPILDTLLAYLKRKRLLLILDNCEHVIEEARRVVAAILRDCPEVYILATSREPLNITGEEAYRMPSLTTSSAVQLFADRATSSDKRFTLTQENVQHVTEICTRLDGIPLAIELAAARIRALSPKQLAEKLDERFRVLTGGDRRALPRHQTMRALIDWSYDLLTDDERILFRKLSIFAGGFTLESASAVCSDASTDELRVLDMLSSLVDKSLVQADAANGGTRYRLLESTRQYAREKLTDSGAYDKVARAHAAAFLTLAEDLDDATETTPDRVWYARAEPELENFRTALGWAFGARGDATIGQRMTAALSLVWFVFGAAEGRRWVQTALEMADAQTPLATLAALDLCEATIAAGLVQYKASLAAADRALTRYRELGESFQIVHAERWMGHSLVLLGDIARGEPLLMQALAEARVLGARRAISLALDDLATTRIDAGELARAREYSSEALVMARSIGAERLAAGIALNLAETEFCGGDSAPALQLAREALGVFREFKDASHLVTALTNIPAYLTAMGRYDEARTAAREGLTAARDMQLAVNTAFILQHLAAVGALRTGAEAPSRDEHFRVARLSGYIDVRLAELDAQREYTEQQAYQKTLLVLRNALGAGECTKLMAEGALWSEDQAVAEAMLI